MTRYLLALRPIITGAITRVGVLFSRSWKATFACFMVVSAGGWAALPYLARDTRIHEGEIHGFRIGMTKREVFNEIASAGRMYDISPNNVGIWHENDLTPEEIYATLNGSDEWSYWYDRFLIHTYRFKFRDHQLYEVYVDRRIMETP